MSDLSRLVGQSLMVQFQGPELTDEVRNALARIEPAGVVLFSTNITSREQVAQLCRDLQDEAKSLGLPPLLIAIDQEGGTVSRLSADFVTVPSPMAQAATCDTKATERCAVITGRQLRAVGISMNFAPVLDINVQPQNPVIRTRSFGDDPKLVSVHGLAALKGYEKANVIATAKHFPGHGDTSDDSHLGLPVVTHKRKHLERNELMPFSAVVRAGIPAIMTAHIVFATIDDLPATLSRPVLNHLLRQDLDFDGVIVTDAMDMGAIVDNFGRGPAAVKAKQAGADLLEMVAPLEFQFEVAEALRKAIKSDEISRKVFERSANRVAALRKGYQIIHDVPPVPDPNPKHAIDALAIAQRSITVRRDEIGLPLDPDARLVVIDCQRGASCIAEDPVDRTALLKDALKSAFPKARHIGISEAPTDRECAAARAAAEKAEVVLFVTRDADLIRPHAAFGQELALTKPLIHASVRAPYDSGVIPAAKAQVLTYGDPPVSLQALVDVLAGRAKAEGKAPVKLVDAEAMVL
jgi:beta-N-acetylhexosaminidase